MLFDRNDNPANERILYQTKPNMLLGCKKAIYGIILLIAVLIISPMAVQFIGEMQVYMISHIKLPLTRYAAIAFFVIILCIVLYIIWQLIGWYSKEYTLTDSKIIIKSGVLSTKKNYMPYATIQDVNTSQNIWGRLFNVGSVSVYSAYDNNQMELSNISDPSEVENIIFSRMVGPRSFQPQYRVPRQDYRQEIAQDYPEEEEYYDEFEPITPINRERELERRQYEYYPENLDFEDEIRPKHTYEYEPYGDGFQRNVNNIVDDLETPRDYPQDNYYNEVRDEYSRGNDVYYEESEPQIYYEEEDNQTPQIEPEDVEDPSQKAIQRHFDKFKR